MLKRTLARLMVILVPAGAAVAGPFEDGFAAYMNGNYATAFKLWRPAADRRARCSSSKAPSRS
jgi:hypothetical protein